MVPNINIRDNSAKLHKTLIWLTIYSIAMAYLESAVVVYLRMIMYPQEFVFPIASMAPDIAHTEIMREAATIIMLACAGYLGGRFFAQRFAFFIYCFAIWDIFYYVFLKLLTGWPESFLTWDILFLIPLVWAGPIIAPVIVSLTMILLAGIVLRFSRYIRIYIARKEWILLITGAFILIVSFTLDYLSFVLKHPKFTELYKNYGIKALTELSEQYIPAKFPWILFAAGELIILTAIIIMYRRIVRNKTK